VWNFKPVPEGGLRVLGLGGPRDLMLLLTEASIRREDDEAPEEGHREDGHEPTATDGCHASLRCEVLDAERVHGRRYASQGRMRSAGIGHDQATDIGLLDRMGRARTL